MKIPTEQAAGSGKRYSAAFKQEALALVGAGRSMSRVARDPGVSIWTLGEWKKAAAKASQACNPSDVATEDPVALAAEVARLRKALARTELHADILKKALAIVGRQPPDFSA